MPRKRKEDEVKIEPSFILYIKEPEIIEDTIEAERKHVFVLTRKAGKSLSGLMITVGSMLTFWSIQYLVNPLLRLPGIPALSDLITSEFIMFLAGFLGVINLICGFVLLAQK
ncbi:hypothetical protein B6U79_00105 [Candidatus Bathyarchaeota archaeon ex4484_231]|nr:MAG: hypothetical protein B6U79_00105 [Candidatus Bathyarchaeota archaeon ex4484_231]RJS76132.1 MAG: hypothetical protein CW712_02400 [Candidatus Bathyarchaeota archaeon]